MTKTLEEKLKSIPPPTADPSIFRRVKRIIINTFQSFIEDDCYSKASALTFYSLLAIVPMLAVLFGIGKGFGFEHLLEKEIAQRFIEQKEITNKLIEFAHSYLESVRGGLIVGVGIILLLWSSIGLLNNIENALNSIWKTRIGRSYMRKATDYLATIIIGPVFFITLISLNVFITTQVKSLQSNIWVEAIDPVLHSILEFFPYFLSWLLFTFIYVFIPNTKVYWKSAITAGIIAGSTFQVWQWLYIKFQIGVASYGAIYGSFAALPLFLIWLQISWLILLAGAELAVAIENELYIPGARIQPISIKTAALLITYKCIEAFSHGDPAPTDRKLAHDLGMSLRHAQLIIETLLQEKILSAVMSSEMGTSGYQPARSVQNITMKDVWNAIENSNEISAAIPDSPIVHKIQTYLITVNELLTDTQYEQPIYKLDPLHNKES
jgi:membrane protein